MVAKQIREMGPSSKTNLKYLTALAIDQKGTAASDCPQPFFLFLNSFSWYYFAIDNLEAAVELLAGALPAVMAPEP